MEAVWEVLSEDLHRTTRASRRLQGHLCGTAPIEELVLIAVLSSIQLPQSHRVSGQLSARANAQRQFLLLRLRL
jgi:hypothetical protein